jgi:D-alanyl-D-alanine carboxypeptidase
MRSYKKKKILFFLLIAVALVAVTILALPSKKTQTKASSAASKPAATIVNSPVPAFDKSQYPIDEASSLWAVVNKGRSLPASYVPAGLLTPNIALRDGPSMKVRTDTAAGLEELAAAAKKAGLNLQLASGYRSYDYQTSVYNGYVSRSGAAAADTFSARPGHSEHQTGLAADLEPASRHCELDQCFGDTPEGKWLAANSYLYGFIIRYQKTTQSLTGYEYEPWHVRYVGKPLALQIHNSGQTLEQFFGLPAYTDYPAQSLQLKT